MVASLIAIVTLAVALAALPQHAAAKQQLDVDEVLAAILAAEDGVESFTANMALTERSALFGDSPVERGTLSMLKPGYVRREVAEPANRILVVAEGLARLYIPRIKQVQEYVLEELSEQGEEALESSASITSTLRDEFDSSISEVVPAGAGHGEQYVIEMLPIMGTETAKRWKKVTLWVESGEWYPPLRTVLLEHADDTTTIELSAVVRNPALVPGDFELDLPPGVEIIRQRVP